MRKNTSTLTELLDLLLAPLSRHTPTREQISTFYKSREWTQLRYRALAKHGRKCKCCGAGAHQSRIVVDHIKSVRTHWHLRLKLSNLQPLCQSCNSRQGEFGPDPVGVDEPAGAADHVGI